MHWPSVQGVVDNIVADIVVWLLGLAGAYMLTRWLKRYYSIFSPPVLVIAGIGIYALLIFAWNQTMAFRHERGQSTTSRYVPATPCQIRMTPSEYKRIKGFLRSQSSKRGDVKKIEILVAPERKDDCLYAKDLREVFDQANWGPAQIVVRNPPRGRAVWFETSVNNELAQTFWEQTLCHLSQDFYHEGQTEVLLNTWMFYVGDKEGGTEDYSPEVTCPNKGTDDENSSRCP